MQLQIGHKIYSKRFDTINGIYVIDRVTPTTALSGNMKFQREYSAVGYVDLVKREKWATTSYWLESPELKQEYQRLRLIRKCETVKYSELSIEQLEAIYKILTK